MEFLRAPNIGPAQQIAERILQLQQQGTAAIGKGIEGATESIVGGIERGRARDLAAKEKTQDKADKMITVDENLSTTLKGLGLDVPVGARFDKDIFKTAITAKGSQVRVEQQIEGKADATAEERKYAEGKEAAKKAEEAKKAAEEADKKLAARAEDAKLIVEKVDQSLPLVGPFTSGLGSYLNQIRGTPGAALEGNLSTVKAKLGFAALSDMREASKTGGALGQITERELDLLQSSVASLDTAQDDETLKRNLMEIKERYSKVADQLNRISKEGKNAKPTKEERADSRNEELKKLGKSVKERARILVAEGLQ